MGSCGPAVCASACGDEKGMGFKAPHETVLCVLRSDAVSESWSLGKPEKAGIVFAGGTSQKTYKNCDRRRFLLRFGVA